MKVPVIGQLATPDTGRDAVHIALAPIQAGCRLTPGQHVNQEGVPGGGLVGIVDPFLKQPVEIGDYFLIFLYPNTVTSLRHEWTHPKFPNATPGETLAKIKEYLDKKEKS